MRHVLNALSPLRKVRAPWLGNVSFYLPAGIVLVASLLVMLRHTIALHADGLWVFSFAEDILNGVPMRGWKPSALPLYFPELTSIVVWRALGLSVPETILVYGVLSWAIIGGCIWWGARHAGLSGPSALRVAFLGLLASAFLHAGNGLLATFQNPFSHGGATLGTFLGILFVARGLRREYGLLAIVVAVVCLCLLVASDLAIVAQFVVPTAACLTLFAAARWANKRRSLWMLGALAAGTAGGRLITHCIRWMTGLAPSPLQPDLGWSSARQCLSRFVEDVGGLFAGHPLLLIGVVVPVSFLIGDGVLQLRRYWGRKEPDPVALFEWWLTIASLAAFGGTIGSVIVTNAWSGSASHRYILPVLVLPPAVLVILRARALVALPSSAIRVVELALLAMIALGRTQPLSEQLRAGVRPSIPKYSCLDHFVQDERLHAGYAQFWEARPATMLSGAQLNVNQVDQHWKPYSWLNNVFWYSRGFWSADERHLIYDFAITNRLDEGWIANRFGEPRIKETCFDLRVWVYDRPEDVEFRNFLRTYAARQTGDRDEWWESPTLTNAGREDGAIRFDGAEGVVLDFPVVPADVMEIASPTRKPLILTFRHRGVDVAESRVDFRLDARRLFALPERAQKARFDSVFVRGEAGGRHDIAELALMSDRGLRESALSTLNGTHGKAPISSATTGD